MVTTGLELAPGSSSQTYIPI